MNKTGTPVYTADHPEDSIRSVEFDEQHALTREQLASLLFDNEDDPRSNSYNRIMIRPKIPWMKVIAAIMVPVILFVAVSLVLSRAGVVKETVALIEAAVCLVYGLLMLKNAVIFAVKLYQLLAPAAIRRKCRFEPSCSEYMILAIRNGDAGLVEQFAKGTKDMGIIAGAGLVVGSFVSGGTATPNFTRFAKNGKVGLIITVVAFFLGNSLMFLFGAVSSIYVGGNDIFEVMLNLNLFYMAVLVLGLNIWTTNDNALYTSGLGLSNIFGFPKKAMVFVAGIIGTVAAIWLYWNFCDWLNILNCTLPPVGIILILHYFTNKGKEVEEKVVDWSAIIGVVAGAVVANLLHWGFASINGMVVAGVCWGIGQMIQNRK